MKRQGIVALLLAACGTLTACGDGGPDSFLDRDTLRVGVRTDLPNIGSRQPDGTLAGLDVDVSREVARRLGKRVRIVPVRSDERERLLAADRIDLAPTYWALPDRKLRLMFAGPYLRTSLDILVRADETRIRRVQDLRGRRLCAVTAAGAAEQVIEERRVPAVAVPAGTYDECVRMLRDRRVDAVSTNDVILAGIRAREGGWVRLLNAGFGERDIAIGLRRTDLAGCEAVNKAITRMYQDGTAARLMRKWFDGTGLNLSTVDVPQFEGCD
ncbi:transporter substrate-binding domain-containing protein [Actinomadura kijaniata]|uniref:transporter substrate-binding domain-containing protein n=1 Tax=Actinomadura kijaniata TaxID=46161 RepID=UPI00082AC7A9|nr:transporter substrate-binding domain-containing protein [Actinomadura kijaniata]